MTAERRVDIPLAASHFLMYRTLKWTDACFSETMPPRLWNGVDNPTPISTSLELENSLRRSVREACADGRAALALSGGIDSAVLARFMPEGSVAYTFRCRVPGREVVDESARAASYASACGLEHRIVDITWEDMEGLAPALMRRKGAPIHSIEVQIAKASRVAREDGFKRLVFGETADVNYGGLTGVLAREWSFGEFVDRFAYLRPYMVLRDPRLPLEPFREYMRADGTIDVHEHLRNIDIFESVGSYVNATEWGGIDLVCPYLETRLAVPLDYERVRRGESKYLIREIFEREYPGWKIPTKIPMPRPTDEWFANWRGPVRPEFLPGCVRGLTGDQRWLVWALERFLDLVDTEGSGSGSLG